MYNQIIFSILFILVLLLNCLGRDSSHNISGPEEIITVYFEGTVFMDGAPAPGISVKLEFAERKPRVEDEWKTFVKTTNDSGRYYFETTMTSSYWLESKISAFNPVNNSWSLYATFSFMSRTRCGFRRDIYLTSGTIR